MTRPETPRLQLLRGQGQGAVVTGLCPRCRAQRRPRPTLTALPPWWGQPGRDQVQALLDAGHAPACAHAIARGGEDCSCGLWVRWQGVP